jgi:hypothetical protein
VERILSREEARWQTCLLRGPCPEFVTKMTLKSALQDVKETTLAAIAGLLGKLSYLASLRRSQGRYEHWGLQTVHGAEAAERALRAAHAEVVAGVLRTPIEELAQDVEDSRIESGEHAHAYIEAVREQFEDLLPAGKRDSPSASHLNSVLVALSKLKKTQGPATPSVS